MRSGTHCSHPDSVNVTCDVQTGFHCCPGKTSDDKMHLVTLSSEETLNLSSWLKVMKLEVFNMQDSSIHEQRH